MFYKKTRNQPTLNRMEPLFNFDIQREGEIETAYIVLYIYKFKPITSLIILSENIFQFHFSSRNDVNRKDLQNL